jgi:hypothetical protein
MKETYSGLRYTESQNNYGIKVTYFCCGILGYMRINYISDNPIRINFLNT